MADDKRDVRNPILFECAWEVANKVGGIYTVIKSKVPVTVSEFGDRYTLIGPLSYKSAPMEVEAEEPSDPHIASTLDSMRVKGVKCLYGRWLIDGNPHVLLFDTGSQYHRLDEWKGDLWNLAGIPTPPSDHETNESIVFGYVVAWFLGEVRCPSLVPESALTFFPPAFSILAGSFPPPSWPISTNGRLGSPFLSAGSAT
jgi:glycogen synthase